MEQESIDPSQYYYSGDGEILRCAQDGRSGTPRGQIMRSMSMTGAQGRKGPTGDASGIVGGDGTVQNGGFNAAAIAERAAYLDAPTEGELSDVPSPSPGSPPSGDNLFGLVAQGIADLLSGGSGPTYRQQLMELRATQGGRHPIYTKINGISNTLIVEQAGIRLVSAQGGPSIDPPLSKPEGVVLQVGITQIVQMFPGDKPKVVFNPGDGPAYEVTCDKNYVITVTNFNNTANIPYPAHIPVDVHFNGGQTIYFCGGGAIAGA
jgi:hypothetical protein